MARHGLTIRPLRNAEEGCRIAHNHIRMDTSPLHAPAGSEASYHSATVTTSPYLQSCGSVLLSGPAHTFDYVLHLDDSVQQVHVWCHRVVLATHSALLSELMRGENYWEQCLQVASGYLGACLELIQFFYLRDLSLLTDRSRILRVCQFFKVPLEIFMYFSTPHTSQPPNFPVYHLTLHAGDQAWMGSEFLRSTLWPHTHIGSIQVTPTPVVHTHPPSTDNLLPIEPLHSSPPATSPTVSPSSSPALSIPRDILPRKRHKQSPDQPRQDPSPHSKPLRSTRRIPTPPNQEASCVSRHPRTRSQGTLSSKRKKGILFKT